jgi:hypothetical protein
MDEPKELFTIIICSSYIYNHEDESTGQSGHVPSQSSVAETIKLEQT